MAWLEFRLQLAQRLLGAVWKLGDVADVESLAWKALDASGLSFDDADDAIAHAFECVIKAWPKWNPAKASASTFLYSVCRFGFVDYQRKTRGRTKWSFAGGRVHERTLPTFVSLDGDDADRDRLVQSLATRPGDSEAGGAPAFEGLLDRGSCTRARDYEELGLVPPRRAA